MQDFSSLIPFTLGLFSTLHCMGMCGGIISALSMGLLPANQLNHTSRYLLILGYNLGRIVSYSIAGILAGTMGMLFIESTANHKGYAVLQYLAGVFLVLLGLHIAGWFPQLKRIEKLGLGVWRLLQPIGKSFLPVDKLYKSLIFGSIWGWLPCGLVYSVLLWTVSTGDPVLGGAYMLAFGLGTLPGMFAAGVAGSELTKLFTKPYVKQGIGVLIVVFGVLSIVIQPGGHHEATENGAASSTHEHHH